MTVTVLLVDDHPAILLGLACIFESDPDLEVVGAEHDPEEALRTFTRTRPDVVVLDLSMPRMDGHEMLQRMRAERPDCRALVLTSSSDPETVSRLVRAGASGYLLKDCESGTLTAAVRSVARGDVPIDPRVTRCLIAPNPGPAGPELTGREHDVLRLVSLGLANKQIATRLGIGESTVKTHLSNVFQRIGVADRTSAALWARAHLRDAATNGS